MFWRAVGRYFRLNLMGPYTSNRRSPVLLNRPMLDAVVSRPESEKVVQGLDKKSHKKKGAAVHHHNPLNFLVGQEGVEPSTN